MNINKSCHIIAISSLTLRLCSVCHSNSTHVLAPTNHIEVVTVEQNERLSNIFIRVRSLEEGQLSQKSAWIMGPHFRVKEQYAKISDQKTMENITEDTWTHLDTLCEFIRNDQGTYIKDPNHPHAQDQWIFLNRPSGSNSLSVFFPLTVNAQHIQPQPSITNNEGFLVLKNDEKNPTWQEETRYDLSSGLILHQKRIINGCVTWDWIADTNTFIDKTILLVPSNEIYDPSNAENLLSRMSRLGVTIQETEEPGKYLIIDIASNSSAMASMQVGGYILSPKYADENNEISGIGLALDNKNKDAAFEVKRLYPNSPAEKVGILIGDRIVRIDDQEISGMEIREVANKLRGEPGSDVSVVVERNGEERSFQLKREIIKLNPQP